MADLLQVIAQIAVLVTLGIAMRAMGLARREHAALLNALVINLTLPATIFLAVRSIPSLSLSLLKIPFLAYLIAAFCAGVGHALGRLFGLERRRTGAVVLSIMLGSTAFIGYPLFEGLFGEDPRYGEVLTAHVFYSEVGTLIPLVTVAVWLAVLYGEKGELRLGWEQLTAVFRFAPFVTLWLAILFYQNAIPSVLEGSLRLLSRATVPLMMLSLGFSLSWADFRRDLPLILAANGTKLVLAPLLALALALLLGIDGVQRLVAVLDAGMPGMLLSLAYAAQYGLDVELTSNLVFTSFFLSLATLPLIALLVL